VTVPLRLLSRDQLRGLRESQLHELLCRRFADDVVAATRTLDAVYATDGDVPLADVQSVVVARLKSIRGLEDEVSKAVDTGGLSVGEPVLWAALATWVIERQLAGGPQWDPTCRPELT
jgi:hypothetical protein